MRRRSGLFIAWLSVATLVAAPASAATIQLTRNSATDYRIVRPADATPVDDYAIDALTHYLKQITGAEFPVVAPDAATDAERCIFVGMSGPARDALGGDPLAPLSDQQHVIRTEGNSIFLFGKGVHANLWAVIVFLEEQLGWRWYSVHGQPIVRSKPDVKLQPFPVPNGNGASNNAAPPTPTVTLEPFDKTRGFTFAYRRLTHHFNRDFFYQHGSNMGFTEKGRDAGGARRSKLVNLTRVHSLLLFIPPTPDAHRADYFDWQDKKNYFETDPEFFTLNEHGERVPDKQLCFSNGALRKELTDNVLTHIDHAAPQGDARYIVQVDANDTPGRFCHCQPCQALEAKYQSPGGPLYDYIIELCEVLEAQHPRALVQVLAYRRSQTQEPPVLRERDRLPDNLIVDFAPIEDAYFADWWNHRGEQIQDTYHDLLRWGKLSNHLWAWMYPNPWGTGARMPVANIERIINNARLMHYAGLERFFTDHNLTLHRNKFVELQQYLLLKLMQDVDTDTDALIAGFTDHFYGDAGATMRTYIRELEQGRKQMTPPDNVTYKSHYYDENTFPYLTVENIRRWQGYFDQMEQATADQPRARFHVRKERRDLDLATIWKWRDLHAAHPDYFADYTTFADRLRAVDDKVTEKQFTRRVAPERVLQQFILDIRRAGAEDPIPSQFSDVDPSRIRQMVLPNLVEDADAAFGYATPVHNPDKPFNFGFFQPQRATADREALPELPADSPATWQPTQSKKYTLQRTVTADQIEPGQYRLYRLGEIEITPKSLIWFSAQSWQTNLRIGRELHFPGQSNTWDAYASLKFEGAPYGGTGDEPRVLCDRVILIKQKPSE